MSKKEKNNQKKKDTRLHGRRIAAWQAVLAAVLTLLVILAVCVTIFIKTYVPNVDRDPHFSHNDSKGAFSLTYDTGMRRYSVPLALSKLRLSVAEQLKKAPPLDIERVDGIYNFLVLGHDKVALNTDVIMVASFDTKNGGLNIMQLPRDTYIEQGAYSHKVNSMFAVLVNEARRNGEADVYKSALGKFAELLETALSIEIDNYALVNLDAFKSIVDAVGGVPVDVPEAMHYDDIYQNLSIHINAGPQVLDGETAMGFVRFRAEYLQADIGRLNAQKIFMTAFIKRVQEKLSVNTVAKIVEQVLRNVTTDISLNDAIYYAKEALSLDLSNVNMMTLPGEAVNAGLSYYVIYRSSTLELINEYFNVYNTDVTDEMFDRELLFTDGDGTRIDKVYRKEGVEAVVNNGESVDANGIYIPRYYGNTGDDGTKAEATKPTVPTPTETVTTVDTVLDTTASEEIVEDTVGDISEDNDESSSEPADSLDTSLDDDTDTETTSEDTELESSENDILTADTSVDTESVEDTTLEEDTYYEYYEEYTDEYGDIEPEK